MTATEAAVIRLFDYQRFAGNKRLAELIAHTQEHVDNAKTYYALADEDVDVWAAGDIDSLRREVDTFSAESDDDE